MAMLVTNPLNETTLTVMDSLGRVVRTVDGNGNATTMSYDAVVGGLVETTRSDALGHTSRSRQDGLGRERQRLDAEGKVTTAMFDAAGNRRAVFDPDLVGESCMFDARNRPTTCMDTKGDTRETRYDAHSNQTFLLDGRGAITRMEFDARDRVTNRFDRIGGNTIFVYDQNSNLVRTQDAERNTTVYEYDARNLRIRETFPSSGGRLDTRSMVFDPGRRLILRIDQAGETDTVEYLSMTEPIGWCDDATAIVRTTYSNMMTHLA